jgi:hypothetical protein
MVIFAEILYGSLLLGCSKTKTNNYNMLTNKNLPIKPKIGPIEVSYQENKQ